jgi:hypothetical protein
MAKDLLSTFQNASRDAQVPNKVKVHVWRLVENGLAVGTLRAVELKAWFIAFGMPPLCLSVELSIGAFRVSSSKAYV